VETCYKAAQQAITPGSKGADHEAMGGVSLGVYLGVHPMRGAADQLVSRSKGAIVRPCGKSMGGISGGLPRPYLSNEGPSRESRRASLGSARGEGGLAR
jgi:hypothetical protein